MLTEVLALAPNVPVWAKVGALPVLQLAPVSKPVPVPPMQVWADAPTGDRQVPANKRAASRPGCRFTLMYAISPNAPQPMQRCAFSTIIVTPIYSLTGCDVKRAPAGIRAGFCMT